MSAYIDELGENRTMAEADAALNAAVQRMRSARSLTRERLAQLLGDRARWSLQESMYADAALRFRRLQRSFRATGNRDDLLLAMAGEARARSRSGDHRGAVEVLGTALQQASESPRRSS